jgi:NAD(P)-dependent dehydrogenase (short-subunit alcohol dehydrogenase family)
MSTVPALPSAIETAIDGILEASVVGSFSKIGPALRRRSAAWSPLQPVEGQVMVVTGATSGLGRETALELAHLGAQVCLVGRNPGRLDEVKRLIDASGAIPAIIEQADLADLDQVDQLADRLVERLDRLDVLIHNAGALLAERQVSPQGIEITLSVHLLAPFLLTERLVPLLERSAPSRVIAMTSGGMYTQRFDLEALAMDESTYRGTTAYARAKRAQVVLTREWQRRYASKGIDFFVTHPGWADTPGLTEALPGFSARLRPLLRSAAEGVDTEVWLATTADDGLPGGRLWLDRRVRSEYHAPWTWVPPAHREAEGEALWAWCDAQRPR